MEIDLPVQTRLKMRGIFIDKVMIRHQPCIFIISGRSGNTWSRDVSCSLVIEERKSLINHAHSKYFNYASERSVFHIVIYIHL